MANVGNFLASMTRECGDFPPDPILSLDWLQNRYQATLERIPWPFLYTEATFNTVAEVTAGTTTVTLGSATVTETTANANGWSSAVVDRYFRAASRSQFYLITAFTDGGAGVDSITLNRNYETATGTTIGYSLFQRIYALAADVREVISMAYLDSPGEIRRTTQSQLDMSFPNRPSLGIPTFWAPAGRNSSDTMTVELYPVPDVARGIIYRYLPQTPSLSDQDAAVIEQVNISVLRAGWLADYWSWRGTHADAPAATLLQSQKYESEFEKRLQEMIIREIGTIPPQTLRLSPRMVRHRWQRQNKYSATGTVAFSDDR